MKSKISAWSDGQTFQPMKSAYFSTRKRKQLKNKYLECVREYQNDLTSHVLAEEHLYFCVQSIFRFGTCCETLFQCIKNN